MKQTLIIISCLLVGLGCSEQATTHTKEVLPIYGEKKLTEIGASDTIYHTVGPFKLVNQYGDTVTETTVKDKIYVADFFFATCQSICPKMSTNLEQVQTAFKNDEVLILSHTVNPIHDTEEVLLDYANRHTAIKNKWHFLTGSKKTIYDLAKNDYLVNALEDDGTPEGFLHSELFLLIDKKQRIRGMYDGTDSLAVAKLIQDITLLKKEGK